MADGSAISWTDATWNPVRGCSRVSEGCRHCYAERVAARFAGPGLPYEGLAVSKLKVIDDDTQRVEARWTGVVRMVPEHLADPLRWRRPRRIFVNSMSDLFHESLTNEQIAAVFGVMAACPQHTFQVLTKRAARMRDWFRWMEEKRRDNGDYWTELMREAISWLDAGGDSALSLQLVEDGIARDGAGDREPWPLPNVWLGVSVENQAAADDRIPELLETPAAVRFISAEPLLGDVTIWAYLKGPLRDESLAALAGDPNLPGLDWVIVGCESGPGARPCNVAWLRDLRDQCAAASVPFFLKQAVESGAGERCDECKRPVAYYIDDSGNGNASCGCTVEGAEACDPEVAYGPGSKRKAGGVIELPYLDGVQHAAFPNGAT